MAIKKLSEGQWVAWNRERTQVVAHGRSLAEAHRAAMQAGYANPIFEYVRPPSLFIGAA
jgi:hypothetical protein